MFVHVSLCLRCLNKKALPDVCLWLMLCYSVCVAGVGCVVGVGVLLFGCCCVLCLCVCLRVVARACSCVFACLSYCY